MKKGRKINTQKSAIKKVVKSSNQGIEKQVMAKRERGITLIALVVTIIIMLILAAVTLNMALGDNGLIQMAKFATNKYEQAAINESLAMNELSKGLGGGSGSDSTTPTETPEGGGGGTPEGQLTAASLNKDNYGDYVDYGLDLSGDKDFTNDWRIFYVGENTKDGKKETRIFLIAADYVPNTCEALNQAEALANMTKSTEEGYGACCSRWTESSPVKYHCNDKHNLNLNSSQPQCSFPEIFMPSGSFCNKGDHYYCSDHVGNTGAEGNINSRCASSLQCTGNWKPFVDNSKKFNCADYAIGGPTLEMWVASWNQKHGGQVENGGVTLYAKGKKTNQTSAESSGYTVGIGSAGILTYYKVNSTKGYGDTLYFPHQKYQNLVLFEGTETAADGSDTENNTSCNNYLLSSPANNALNYIMSVNYTGQVTSTYIGSVMSGIRPVVSLKPDVKLTKRNNTGAKTVYDINM